jgi:septum formation protein
VYHWKVRLILASASPRRADLLASAGFTFDVMPVELDEGVADGESPEAYVERLACEKARQVARRNSGRLVIGADTTVVIDERILGKPAGDGEAVEMLRMLSGRVHRVMTGVAVVRDGTAVSEVVTTEVRFLHMSEFEISWYVASGEPHDKAGAYGVQGLASRFVERIDGSYSNVVGLPVATVYRLLKSFGDVDAPAAGSAPSMLTA